MTEYLVPTRASETEFTEKRSTFIGRVFPVETEEEARARIDEVKKKHHDARHNCWCYLLHEGNVTRYSDDGEPQGTAGQPMLEVFQREGVENVCCVVTRYFGGVLLGTGGLLRAYTRSAKDALTQAGVAPVRLWAEISLDCPYNFLERMKQEVERAQGQLGEMEYGEQVCLHARLPAERFADFAARVTELTAGQLVPNKLEERLEAGSREK